MGLLQGLWFLLLGADVFLGPILFPLVCIGVLFGRLSDAQIYRRLGILAAAFLILLAPGAYEYSRPLAEVRSDMGVAAYGLYLYVSAPTLLVVASIRLGLIAWRRRSVVRP
jgi:hypothetical protein